MWRENWNTDIVNIPQAQLHYFSVSCSRANSSAVQPKTCRWHQSPLGGFPESSTYLNTENIQTERPPLLIFETSNIVLLYCKHCPKILRLRTTCPVDCRFCSWDLFVIWETHPILPLSAACTNETNTWFRPHLHVSKSSASWIATRAFKDIAMAMVMKWGIWDEMPEQITHQRTNIKVSSPEIGWRERMNIVEMNTVLL